MIDGHQSDNHVTTGAQRYNYFAPSNCNEGRSKCYFLFSVWLVKKRTAKTIQTCVNSD
jgi:hypothetical protein